MGANEKTRATYGIPAGPDPSQHQLWDTEDLAAFLRVTVDTVKRMRADGTGPAYITIRRAVRYVPGHVRRWVDGQATVQTRRETD